MTPTPDKSGGQYCLIERIARGGMAVIYKGLAYDAAGLKKNVCVKKILPEIAANQEFIDALVSEAKIAVTLSHGNIAQIFDLGKSGDDYYMVMEFVDGKTVSQINRRAMKRGDLIPIEHACFVIAETLAGLNYVHRRADDDGKPLNIVHRDVSPQNIMVSYSGTVKIIDFGIAKAATRLGVTESGVLKGKFAYMSPEQARGETIDHYSDIYSLGIIFHELLTGKRLFKAEDNRETLRNVRKSRVLPPSQISPNLPAELDEIVMKCLAKDRSRRYSSAAEMRDDLMKFFYQAFPKYQPSELATYVRDLFADEVDSKADHDEKEDATPAIIIDGTHSALSGKKNIEEATGSVVMPVDINQYIPYVKNEEEAAEEGHEDEEIDEEKEEQTAYIKKRWRWTAIIGAIAAFGIAVGVAWVSKKDEAKKVPIIKPGFVEIVTVPDRSNVFVDGELVGNYSPVRMDNLGPGEHKLRVEKKDYETYRDIITILSGKKVKSKVVLVKTKPKYAKIEITSDPKGAIVYMDDTKTSHRTPAVIDDIVAKKSHTIGLHMSGYHFWKRKFVPKPGESRHFEVSLKRNFASIVVTSNPKKALVLLNGAPVGETPWKHKEIEPGKNYRIEIWKDGYKSAKKNVKLGPGREIRWEAVLEKLKRRR